MIHNRFSCFFVSATLVLASSMHAQTVRKLVDFEDQAAGTAIFNQYPGVQFVGGTASGSPLQIVEPPLGTISGANALRSQNLECEFNCATIVMQFAQGQHRVRVSTGLLQASTFGDLAAVLRGYSDANRTNQVAQSA